MNSTDFKQIETILDKRLGKLEKGINQKFDGVDKKFEKIDKRFDGVDQRFEKIDKRFDGVDQRFDGVDQRFDSLTLDMADVQKKTDVIKDIHEYTKDIRKRIVQVEDRVEILEAAA